MATSHVLKTVFLDETGASFSMSFRYVDPDFTTEQVQTFVNALITNKSIFLKQPTVAKSADLVATTTTNVPLE